MENSKVKVFNQYEMSDWISNKLKSNQSFSCVRLGHTEHEMINHVLMGERIPDRWIHYTNTAGIFPHTQEFCRNQYYPKIDVSLNTADAIGQPGVSSKTFSPHFQEKYLSDKIGFIECRFLDPAYLIDYDDPWTKYLNGKKVLAINSSASSIEKQWDIIDDVWGDNREKICPFDLVEVIRSPFSPSICGGDIYYNDKKIENWIESSEMICDMIDNVDFDVALIGAGAYAPVLSSYIKNMNKSAITTCGATQLFFGVKGKRWSKNNAKHCEVFNDSWIYPVDEDLPLNLKFFESFEGGNAYW